MIATAKCTLIATFLMIQFLQRMIALVGRGKGRWYPTPRIYENHLFADRARIVHAHVENGDFALANDPSARFVHPAVNGYPPIERALSTTMNHVNFVLPDARKYHEHVSFRNNDDLSFWGFYN